MINVTTKIDKPVCSDYSRKNLCYGKKIILAKDIFVSYNFYV